jgi:hypothetical protein
VAELCPDEGPDADKFKYVEMDDCDGFAALEATGKYRIDEYDNCEGFEDLEDNPDYKIVEIEYDHDPDLCACCGCDCCKCKGYWDKYTLTPSGFADTVNCASCADRLNTPVTVTNTPGSCLWTGPVGDEDCGFTDQWVMECFGDDDWRVTPGITGRGETHQLLGSLCECGGEFTVINTHLDFFCDSTGSTVSVAPAPDAVWISCGKPEPTCGEGFAARAAVPKKATAPTSGPGTELKALLGELGFSARSGCGCDDKARQMDAWGVAGCQARRTEILDWLRAEQAKRKWSERWAAAVNAVRTGLALRLNPIDPAPGLLDIAIERAELPRASEVATAATPPCRHLGESLTGKEREALGLDHRRDWRTCAKGHGDPAGVVCTCVPFPRGCRGCPDYEGDAGD